MVWPSYFPDGCPEEANCSPTSGVVYRVLTYAPEGPKREDFLSHREMFPSQHFSMPECFVCSLSVYRDLADALRLTRRVTKMKGKPVAIGRLDSTHGLIRATP